MKSFKLILIIMPCVLLFSCQKNVLDKKPLAEIDESLVWKDVNLATLYVNNIYLNLPGGVMRDLDCATDIGEQGHNWMPCQAWNTGDITPGYAPFADEWYNCYEQIRNANTFLKNYTTIAGDPAAIDQLRGQALFLRGWYYAELVNLFGGVPIIKTPQSLSDSLFVSRSPYDDCINFIVTDLDEAATLLPAQWEDASIGRATSGAALALKSRMLLFAASPLHNPGNDNAKWQKAADAAKAVIDLGTYALHPGYYSVFHEDNNEEVIFDIQYAYPTRTQNIEYWSSPQGMLGAYGASRPTQDLVDMYEMSNGEPITDPGSGYKPQDPYTNRDPRFYASILYNGASWRGASVETFTDGANGPGSSDQYSTGNAMTGYYSRKFINENNPLGSTDKANENWILIRYAEILLNYAEAEIALGNDAEARTYINMIRARAGLPDLATTLSGDNLSKRYCNERVVELEMEELHFFDVRRWKTAPDLLSRPVHKMTITNENNVLTYKVEEMETRSWRDAFYYLPIPQDETNKNPNLQQNPDY